MVIRGKCANRYFECFIRKVNGAGDPPEDQLVQLFVLKLQAKKNELEIDYQNKTKGAPAHFFGGVSF